LLSRKTYVLFQMKTRAMLGITAIKMLLRR
jgi:hypothetical protein